MKAVCKQFLKFNLKQRSQVNSQTVKANTTEVFIPMHTASVYYADISRWDLILHTLVVYLHIAKRDGIGPRGYSIDESINILVYKF